MFNGIEISEKLSIEDLSKIFLSGSEDKDKKWAACLALGLKSDSISLSILVNAFKSKDWTIRRISAESIKNHRKALDVKDDIINLLGDENEYVKRTACVTIAELKINKAHDDIVNLINSNDPYTRKIAIEAIASIWKNSDFELILKKFTSDDNREVRLSAAEKLREHVNSDTWRTLFDIWCIDSFDRHKLWSCEIAEQFGEINIKEKLLNLSHDKNGHIRKAAKRALERLIS